MTDFLSLCKDRYAVRKFTDKMVSEEDIVYLKEAIRLAPSAANRQPWKFIFVFRKKQKRNSASVIIESGLRQHPCMSLP